MMKKVGLLGGTFDPIHFGHLNLAIELKERHQLDEVWFIPAQANPLKKAITSAEHRLAMLKVAIEPIEGVKVSDVELKRPPPSYTIDTLKILMKDQPNHYFLLLGEDSLTHFDQWRQPEEIVKLVPLLIGSRTGDWKGAYDNELILESIQKGMTKTRLLDISATEIRQRLANSQYCGHLVPAPVLNYIRKNSLFMD